MRRRNNPPTLQWPRPFDQVQEQQPGTTRERPFAPPTWLTFGEDSVALQISDAAAPAGRVWIEQIESAPQAVTFHFSGRLRDAEMEAIEAALGNLCLAIVNGRSVMVAKCWQ